MELQEGSRKLYRNAALMLYWPFIAWISWLLTKADYIYIDDTRAEWAIANIFLHMFPFFIYILKDGNNTNFPFVETFGIFNTLHYGISVFYINPDDYQLGRMTVEGLSTGFICHVIFYAAYYVFLYSRINIKGIRFVKDDASIRSLKYFGYIMLLAFLGSTVIPGIYHIGYVGIYVYIGLFIFFWRQKNLAWWEKLILIFFIMYESFNRALGGLLSPFALLLFFLGLCILLTRSNRWLIGIALVAFVWFYSIFSNVKFAYRSEVWYGNRGRTLADKIKLIQELNAEERLQQGVNIQKDYKGKDHILWRFTYQSSALSMVLQKTPSEVPFWNGESYVPLVTKFIPRFFWPDKPEENMGYNFGTRYGIIRSWNTTTSINTPILTELYINFGYMGLYLGSAILGAFYFLLTRLYNSRTTNFPSRIIGMAIIFPMMIWESNFSLVFGNLLLITFVFILIYRGILYMMK